MAERSFTPSGKTGSSGPTQDFGLFIALFIGLFVLWSLTGGPDRLTGERVRDSGPRNELRSATSVNFYGESGGTRRDLEKNISEAAKELERIQEKLQDARRRGVASPYEGMVSIRAGRARDRLVYTEYVELIANRGNTTDVSITGWVVESIVTGQRGTIGGVTQLPFPGIVNAEAPLFLSPGEKVIVATGRSPIGASFRVNQCTGYFEQFQDFSPRLRRDCSSPLNEFDEFSSIPVTNVRLEDDDRDICREFVRQNINRCEINRVSFSNIEPKIDQSCRDFVEDTYTYSGCVENHRFDPNFFKNEWRVFLGSSAELWREKREIIRLLDQEGRTVDILDY